MWLDDIYMTCYLKQWLFRKYEIIAVREKKKNQSSYLVNYKACSLDQIIKMNFYKEIKSYYTIFILNIIKIGEFFPLKPDETGQIDMLLFFCYSHSGLKENQKVESYLQQFAS